MKNFNLKTINAHKILFAASLLASGAVFTSAASAAPGQRHIIRQDLRHDQFQPNRQDFNRGPLLNLNRSVRGIVTNDLDGNDFKLRLNNGEVIRVIVPSGEPKKLSKGDLVEAYGHNDNGTFRATSATILHNA